jgi:hypothetical protein
MFDRGAQFAIEQQLGRVKYPKDWVDPDVGFFATSGFEENAAPNVLACDPLFDVLGGVLKADGFAGTLLKTSRQLVVPPRPRGSLQGRRYEFRCV